LKWRKWWKRWGIRQNVDCWPVHHGTLCVGKEAAFTPIYHRWRTNGSQKLSTQNREAEPSLRNSFDLDICL
jgi:hypothetical protein